MMGENLSRAGLQGLSVVHPEPVACSFNPAHVFRSALDPGVRRGWREAPTRGWEMSGGKGRSPLGRCHPGNGLLLFFRADDFDEALARARTLADQIEEEPQTNPATGTREFALRDPDGYYVMVSALT